MQDFLTVLSAIIALAAMWTTGRYLGRYMFDGEDDIWDCVRASLTPDIVSLFRGEFWEDFVQSFKLSVFVGFSMFGGFATYAALAALFGLPF